MRVHVFNNFRRILSENIKHQHITASFFFSYISSVNLFILISCHLCTNEKDNFDMKIIWTVCFFIQHTLYSSYDGFRLKSNIQNLSETHLYLTIPVISFT